MVGAIQRLPPSHGGSMFPVLELLASAALGSSAARTVGRGAPYVRSKVKDLRIDELKNEQMLGLNHYADVKQHKLKYKAILKKLKGQRNPYAVAKRAEAKEMLALLDEHVEPGLTKFYFPWKDLPPVIADKYKGSWLITPVEELIISTYFKYMCIQHKHGPFYEYVKELAEKSGEHISSI